MLRMAAICAALTAAAAYAQTKPAFEVATVKPSGPLDMAKLTAAAKAGGRVPIGPRVDSGRAEYTFMSLRSLIALAYGVRGDQVAGPDWMEEAPFDIVAKMPEGTTKEDAPKMLQTLLEERFRLVVHRTNAEHSVLALVVGKGGLKMKASARPPVEFDDNAPEPPGVNIADGIRISASPATGAMMLDMGLKGKISMKVDTATMAMHMDFSMVTMEAIAAMLTQRSTNNDGPAVVDMTGIKGNYDGSVDVGPALPGAASDPDNGAFGRMTNQVEPLGLKLESRKAMVEKLVIDHVEKTPTGN